MNAAAYEQARGAPRRSSPRVSPSGPRAAKVPVQVNRVGSMLTVFFSEKPVFDAASARALRHEALRRASSTRLLEDGVYFPPSQFEAAFLSTAHTERRRRAHAPRRGDRVRRGREGLGGGGATTMPESAKGWRSASRRSRGVAYLDAANQRPHPARGVARRARGARAEGAALEDSTRRRTSRRSPRRARSRRGSSARARSRSRSSPAPGRS